MLLATSPILCPSCEQIFFTLKYAPKYKKKQLNSRFAIECTIQPRIMWCRVLYVHHWWWMTDFLLGCSSFSDEANVWTYFRAMRRVHRASGKFEHPCTESFVHWWTVWGESETEVLVTKSFFGLWRRYCITWSKIISMALLITNSLCAYSRYSEFRSFWYDSNNPGSAFNFLITSIKKLRTRDSASDCKW